MVPSQSWGVFCLCVGYQRSWWHFWPPGDPGDKEPTAKSPCYQVYCTDGGAGKPVIAPSLAKGRDNSNIVYVDVNGLAIVIWGGHSHGGMMPRAHGGGSVCHQATPTGVQFVGKGRLNSAVCRSSLGGQSTPRAGEVESPIWPLVSV